MSYKVVHIIKGFDNGKYSHLEKYIDDNDSIFIIEDKTENFWHAEDFFYRNDIGSFIVID